MKIIYHTIKPLVIYVRKLDISSEPNLINIINIVNSTKNFKKIILQEII